MNLQNMSNSKFWSCHILQIKTFTFHNSSETLQAQKASRLWLTGSKDSKKWCLFHKMFPMTECSKYQKTLGRNYTRGKWRMTFFQDSNLSSLLKYEKYYGDEYHDLLVFWVCAETFEWIIFWMIAKIWENFSNLI